MAMNDSQLRGRTCSIALGAAALAAFWLACPAAAAPSKRPVARGAARIVEADAAIDRLRPGTLASFAPSLLDAAKFSFTAPGQASNARAATAERAFRFTPSGQGENRHPVSVGVRSRVVALAPDTSRAAAPPPVDPSLNTAAYNVDLSVGWRGFAVSGGYTRADNVFTGTTPTSAVLPRRDAVDLGLSYGGRSWKTSVQIGTETTSPLAAQPGERRYTVEFGGAYAVSPSVALTGGVRYKMTPLAPGLADLPKPDHAVYLGTAVSF